MQRGFLLRHLRVIKEKYFSMPCNKSSRGISHPTIDVLVNESYENKLRQRKDVRESYSEERSMQKYSLFNNLNSFNCDKISLYQV